MGTRNRRVLAIDASLNRLGFAVDKPTPGEYRWGAFRPTHKASQPIARLADHQTHITKLLLETDPDVMAIEDYAYSRGQGAHQIGELGGILRVAAFQLGIPVLTVNPQKSKILATGHGRAEKADVMTAARIDLTDGISVREDEADALWLWALTHCWLDDPMGQRLRVRFGDHAKRMRAVDGVGKRLQRPPR